MKIVVDTNVAVSGLLWGGPPNQILKWARDETIRILACDKMLEEIRRVLQYPKFSNRLAFLHLTAREAMAYFLNLVTLVANPKSVPTIVRKDPFDNLLLALASHHHAKLIVSGDKHLLDLESFDGIQIVTPAEGVQVINRLQNQ